MNSLIQQYDIIGFIESFQTKDNEFDHEFESNELVIFSAMRTVCNKPAGGVTVLVKRCLHGATTQCEKNIWYMLMIARLYLYIKDIFSD